MSKNRGGFQPPIEEIRADDAVRAEQREQERQLVLRRRGRKGSRVWGYGEVNGKRGRR